MWVVIVVIVIVIFVVLILNSIKHRVVYSKLKSLKLWLDHMSFTREYILSEKHNLPTTQDTVKRLIANQEDIARFYDIDYPGSFDVMYPLLTEHITIASEIVKGSIKGEDVTQQKRLWIKNAVRIAEALHSVNKNYKLSVLQDLLLTHLSTTEKEVGAILSGESGISEYDIAVRHMEMFDYYLMH